jgi:hypothetical protein
VDNEAAELEAWLASPITQHVLSLIDEDVDIAKDSALVLMRSGEYEKARQFVGYADGLNKLKEYANARIERLRDPGESGLGADDEGHEL